VSHFEVKLIQGVTFYKTQFQTLPEAA